MELCQPDVFIYTSEHIVCGIRQCFFDLSSCIGQTDSVAFEGYPSIDFGADAVCVAKDVEMQSWMTTKR